MQQSKSRRKFINKLGLATGGVFLFASTDVLHALDNNSAPFAGYNPFAEASVDIRTSLDPKEHIRIYGKIYSRDSRKPLTNALLEVWHLSPGTKKYRHHARFETNANGEYQFYTDKPAREAGKLPRIFFKLQGNNSLYFTELIIGAHQAYITGVHWASNNQLNELMQPVKEDSKIQFNLSI